MQKPERHVDLELKALKSQILEMGAAVEKAIEFAVRGLIERNVDLLKQVHVHEAEINRYHILVDETSMRVLARQSPMASDLRLVLGCLKINSDLERMGDQAVNIAHLSREYLDEATLLKPLADFPEMARAVREMTHQALDAFVHRDQELAKEVLKKDDAVDAFKRKIFDELIEVMKKDQSTVDRAMELLLVSRNLERIGDHATNIAEDVIFVASGIDIRHGLHKFG